MEKRVLGTHFWIGLDSAAVNNLSTMICVSACLSFNVHLFNRPVSKLLCCGVSSENPWLCDFVEESWFFVSPVWLCFDKLANDKCRKRSFLHRRTRESSPARHNQLACLHKNRVWIFGSQVSLLYKPCGSLNNVNVSNQFDLKRTKDTTLWGLRFFTFLQEKFKFEPKNISYRSDEPGNSGQDRLVLRRRLHGERYGQKSGIKHPMGQYAHATSDTNLRMPGAEWREKPSKGKYGTAGVSLDKRRKSPIVEISTLLVISDSWIIQPVCYILMCPPINTVRTRWKGHSSCSV